MCRAMIFSLLRKSNDLSLDYFPIYQRGCKLLSQNVNVYTEFVAL